MKLYGHPHSSCTRKVLVTLAEKAEEAEFIPVDLFTGEQKTAAHLVRHPFGVVPVLDDDGFVLFESRAILRYLDARAGRPTLTPAAPRDAARMNQWLSVDQSYIAPHTSTLAVQRLVRRHQGLPPEAEVVAAAESALARALAVVDDALRSQPFVAGDAFSLADISLMPYVAGLDMIGAGHVLEQLPSLGAWWARVRERPSWRRATEPSYQKAS